MVDSNDPEIQESMKYLLVTKEERIRLATMPFDPKKNIWIADHKEGFIAGIIDSIKGEVTVKTNKGEV